MKLSRFLGLAPLQIAQALIGFGAIAAFTRLMSAAEFGRYALALSISMFAHTLVFTWVEAAAYRFFAAARAEKRLNDHFATVLALGLVLGASAMVITAALLLLCGAHQDVIATSVFAAGSAVFRFLTRLSRESERAAMALGRYACWETLYLVLGFAAGVALLTKLHLGAAAPFAGLMLAGLIVFIADAPRFIALARGGAPSLPRVASYAGYGAPLAMAIAIDLGVQALTRVLLGQHAGAASIGAYAAAFGLARPLDLIFMSAGAAMTPALLTAFEERGAEAARAEAKRIFVTLAALCVPAAVGICLLTKPLTHLMIGADLAGATASVLPWLAIAGLFSGFNLYYWSEAFQLSRRTGLRALIMLAPGAVQIALTLLLSPNFGAMGAAIAAAVASVLGSALLALIGQRSFALPLPLSDLARIGASTAMMTLVLIAMPAAADALGFINHVAVGAIAYALTAFALNLFDARTRASAVSQRLSVRVGALLQNLFTDGFNVRARR